MEERNTKYRAWSVTINNPTENDHLTLSEMKNKNFEIVGQMEVGETGTVHWQGAVRSKTQKSFLRMKKWLPRAHLEPCRNWQALKNYCKKFETRLEAEKPVKRNIAEEISAIMRLDLIERLYKENMERCGPPMYQHAGATPQRFGKKLKHRKDGIFKKHAT